MHGLLALTIAAALNVASAVTHRRLERNETVGAALIRNGVAGEDARQILEALKQAGFDCRKARAGETLSFERADGALQSLEYRKNLFHSYRVAKDASGFVGTHVERAPTTELTTVDLSIRTSVWDATTAQGERPDLAVTLSDVFAWDVDFYRDVQKGDHLKAVVERQVIDGRTVGYGNVLAASYRGSTVGLKRTFRYQLPTGEHSYFLEDGTSARKTFLKSPLKFAPITSGFGTRFHPILNYVGAHNGVDYGTPVGTPVWAVADGSVTRAGWDNGGGNMVCLRHTMSFETCYLHLSKINVRVGERLSQKTVIGESGSTGLSTGPHLHFALKRGGQYINPLNQNFPRAEPLPASLKADFATAIEPYLHALADPEAQAPRARPALAAP